MEELEMSRTLERANLKHSKANKNKKLAFIQQVNSNETMSVPILKIHWN